MRQIIIIGSGPAGYTAGIYAARAGLEPLIVASSVEAGGELMKTTEVENFPGFPDGIQGPELMFKLQEQAEKFGAEVLLDDVTSVDLTGDVKKVTLGSGTVEEALTVIFATGSASSTGAPPATASSSSRRRSRSWEAATRPWRRRRS
jgi:thioredoxin reductase (NADPH)